MNSNPIHKKLIEQGTWLLAQYAYEEYQQVELLRALYAQLSKAGCCVPRENELGGQYVKQWRDDVKKVCGDI